MLSQKLLFFVEISLLGNIIENFLLRTIILFGNTHKRISFFFTWHIFSSAHSHKNEKCIDLIASISLSTIMHIRWESVLYLLMNNQLRVIELHLILFPPPPPPPILFPLNHQLSNAFAIVF